MVIIGGAVSSLHPKSLRAEDTNTPTELTDYTEGFCVNAIWRKPFCEISGFCGRKYKINLCGRLLGYGEGAVPPNDYLLSCFVFAACDGGKREFVEHHVITALAFCLLIEDEDVAVVGLQESGIG